MEKILVSACLVGERVRYNGERLALLSEQILKWKAEGRVVLVCPEVAGGLPVPRPPAEIIASDGAAVLSGASQVKTKEGQDVSAAFVSGAYYSLEQAEKAEIRFALLKSGSPSCGNEQIYTGQFDGSKKPGQGVTASLLTQAGIKVFNEHQLPELIASLED